MRRWAWLIASCAVWTSAARAQVVCGSRFFVGPPVPTPAGTALAELMADVDGDGVMDRVLIDHGLTVEYRGRGGLVRSTAHYPAPGAPDPGVTVALPADIDGDRAQEIVAAADGRVFVVKAGAAGALGSLGDLDIAPLANSPTFGVGRFRSKSQVDIVVESAGGAYTLHHWSMGAFVKGPTIMGLIPPSDPFNALAKPLLAAADLDGDGIDDLLYPGAMGVSVARLGARAAWEAFTGLAIVGGYLKIATGDFDGNGMADVAVLGAAPLNQPPLRAWLQGPAGVMTALPDATLSVGRDPLLTGDLTGDGAAEIVAAGRVAELVGGAWHLFPIAEAPIASFALFDWTGDGLLDLMGRTTTDLGVLPGARADIGVEPTNPPAVVPEGTLTPLTFTVTNHGPAATDGLAVTSDFAGASVTCGATSCQSLKLAPGASTLVTITVTPTGSKLALAVSACGALVDPVAANNTAAMTLTVVPAANLAVIVGMSVENDALAVQARVGSDGPDTATAVTLSIVVPEGASGIAPQSSLPQAACTVGGGSAMCALPSLAKGELWTVTVRGALPYHGQELTTTATVTSSVLDPNTKDNTAVFTLPAISVTGGPGGSAGGAGCACGFSGAEGAEGRPSAGTARHSWSVFALLVLVGSARRRRGPRRRLQVRGADREAPPDPAP